MTEQTAVKGSPFPTEADVAAYLERHPDFFVDHEHLLQSLTLPHDSGRAISLVERQVHLFREQRDTLRHELSGLIGIARQNDRLFAKSKRLLMQLLDAESLSEVAAVLDESVRQDFGLNGATLLLITPSPATSPQGTLRYLSPEQAKATFDDLLERERPLFGRIPDRYRDALFQNPERVASAAIIPLRKRYCLGLLAISSDQEDYFDSSMGSLFLSYISDTLSRLLPPLLTQGDDSGVVDTRACENDA
ncbi:MAG: DUF484 family protein [Halomonadaceae bacterium]|nr:MAG: DUF484 family protein [Halomonadaceae bacterium]